MQLPAARAAARSARRAGQARRGERGTNFMRAKLFPLRHEKQTKRASSSPPSLLYCAGT